MRSANCRRMDVATCSKGIKKMRFERKALNSYLARNARHKLSTLTIVNSDC